MFAKRTIRIEVSLYERVKRLVHAQECRSVDEYVARLIERELRTADEQAQKAKILQQMRGLGYIE